MGEQKTFTFLQMGSVPFFDMLNNLSNLVSEQRFSFDAAVPEALSFTVTNEVMDIDGEYGRLKTLFKLDGYLKESHLQQQLIEEVRRYVHDNSIIDAWVAQGAGFVTNSIVSDLQQAATL